MEENGQQRNVRTSYANAINVFWDDSAAFNNFVELGPSSVENDRVEADTIEKTETKGEFLELLKDSAADFYDCKLGRLGRV